VSGPNPDEPTAVTTGKADSLQPDLPNVDTAPTAPIEDAAAVAAGDDDDDVYKVTLDMYEGPLDLLLHLIRKHELDILDIPVSFITEKYLAYLDMMQSLQIDVASEYLVMAATLTYMKSRMLLPPDPNAQGDDEEEEELDPRADLVRRLLEYQKYKHAAAQLGGRSRLNRDVFARGSKEPMAAGRTELASVSMFKLFDAFERVLKRADQVFEHEVLFERVSLTERIVELTELLNGRRRLRFHELFAPTADGRPLASMDLVVTFLALL
jgi:segregation and condensation protein A